jgi:hypothetical protein
MVITREFLSDIAIAKYAATRRIPALLHDRFTLSQRPGNGRDNDAAEDGFSAGQIRPSRVMVPTWVVEPLLPRSMS